MVGEMAIALVLLTAGGLMVKSVARLQATELGFVPESVLTVRLVLPAPQYDRARGSQFIVDLIDAAGVASGDGSIRRVRQLRRRSRAAATGRMATLPGGATPGALEQYAGRRAVGVARLLRHAGHPAACAAASSRRRIAPVSRRSWSSTRPRRAPTGPARIRSASESPLGQGGFQRRGRSDRDGRRRQIRRGGNLGRPRRLSAAAAGAARVRASVRAHRRRRRRRSFRRSAPRSSRSIPIFR